MSAKRATALKAERGAGGSQLAELFAEACASADDVSPWERLEEAAASDEARSRELLELYRARLEDAPPRALLDRLSHRAVRFAADCFGENGPEVVEILRAVLRETPDADWAFKPLVVALTMAERWPEVLDAYDARLAAGRDGERRTEFLEHAARIAKDFTRDHVRAIGYLDRLFRLHPADAQVAASLERLLERDERWDELVAVWRLRLEGLAEPEARGLRLRLARVLHEKVGQPDAALAAARPLLSAPDADAGLDDFLERVLADERATAETRIEALEALRPRLDASGAAARMPALLAIGIGFSEGQRLRALRRECGERLHALGDLSGALDQYVALAPLAPEDREIEDRLRQLAELARDPARLALALAASARACAADGRRVELLVRAARVEDRQLGRKVEAAALFERAVAEPATPNELRVESLRRLEELYEALGDPGRRTGALERLAAALPKADDQRLAWAHVARLALEGGDVDRSLAAWRARLALDPGDAEALAAAHGLLVGGERWPAVIELLRKRIESAPAPHQIRADLVEIATLARDRLRDPSGAIETWRELAARFGEDDEIVGALADLLMGSGRFDELAELLTRNADLDRGKHAALLARLGDVLAGSLGDPRGALPWYGRALEVEPANERARAGLSAMLADADLGPLAAERLARAAEETDSWQLLLDLVPPRLRGAADAPARVRLLEEAARRAEARAGDPARALAWLCEAMPLAPGRFGLEREVVRLSELTGDFAPAVRALGETITAAELPPPLLAHLNERRGTLLEERLRDIEGARASYAAALALTPERLELRQALVRTTVLAGDLGGAATLLIDAKVSDVARAGVLLPLYESLAREAGTLPAAASALSRAADVADGRLRRELHGRVADLLLEDERDVEGADGALGRALEADPGHVPTLLRRAELQRQRPDARLVETLEVLARAQPTHLDFLREAADVARERLGDERRALDLLGRLGEQAMRLARLGQRALGGLGAVEAAAHAVDEAVRLHVASRDPGRVRLATALLLEAARLPAADEMRRDWLRQAAELTEAALADKAGAIRIWHQLYEETPDGEAAREALARLYESERRYSEAVTVRVAELGAARGAERRLALRLEIVRLGGLAERESDGRDVLLQSLAERPGHEPTMRKLSEVLLSKGRAGELAEVLAQQARILGEEAQPSAAAALWAELARLAEKALGDQPQAASAWEHVAELEPTWEALDALGRLALSAGEPRAAAAWIDRRLAMTEGEARGPVAIQLARAYQLAGQRHRAVACLERTLDELAGDGALRALLVDVYREAESWEPLARVLAEGCDHTADEAAIVAHTREAAEIYGRLGLLERAVPVLERAVRLVPGDEALRLALAEGLRRCGRLDEARAELLRLVEQAGWRRSRKRAALHERLGEIARAQGDAPLALEQLELASSMDASNPGILRQLAEVAEAAGALDRAERAYRALLVQGPEAERSRSATDGPGPLATTEILLRLFGLARARGQSGEADELLDSALAAAIKDPGEARRLQQGLLERGAHDVLGRLFERRLAQLEGSPAQAEVYGELAESLRAQGRAPEAFDAQLLAAERATDPEVYLGPLVTLARDAGKLEPLVERLLALVERRRRGSDTAVAGALLLRIEQIVEEDFGDLERALELLRRAEDAEPSSLAVLSRLAHLAGKRHDDAERGRIAALLKTLAADAPTPQAAAEALYRAAALELPRAETRDAGVASLCEALEKGPDIERASALVGEAGLPQEELVKILPLYERVARQSNDERVLLDYLDRRASTAAATVAEVREAVDLAVALDRQDRIQPLLARLADLAGKHPEHRRDAAWASLELVGSLKTAGDLDGAAQVLARAADAGTLEVERVTVLTRDLAARAGRAGNLRLGAELLERLRSRAPADESVWRPLLDHYVALQDRPALERVVSETLPLLPEVTQRTQLRLALAKVLLDRDDRDAAAAEILRDVLLEERRQPLALAWLSGYCERTGADDDLRDLLGQRLEAAVELGDQDQAVEVALRLGDVLGAASDEARSIYERALEVAPRRRELLRRLVATGEGGLTRARAERMEELLRVETGDDAAKLAQELSAAWTSLGDRGAARRALETGRTLAPADATLAHELAQLYRSGEAWALLADLLADQAEHEADHGRAVARLLEAAELRETRLLDARGASALLQAARKRVPDDDVVLARFARALVGHGEREAAVAEVRGALESTVAGPERRLPLLLLLAELEGGQGDHRAAVTVLREAFALAPDVAAPKLGEALESWRREASARNAPAEAKESTLGLADLARRRGDTAAARGLLGELLESGGVDADTLRLAADLAESEGDVAGAIDATYQLMHAEQGEGQVAAARHLVELSEQADRIADATAAIEAVVAERPEQTALFEVLASLYERSGDLAKVAMMLYDQGSRTEDGDQRFDFLRRAGAVAVEAGDGPVAVMALTEALAIRPGDEEGSLLLSSAYVLVDALTEAAALLTPLVAEHKGKPSAALAGLHLRLARIAGLAGDTKGQLAALTHALDADKRNGEIIAEVAERAEEAGDLDLALKALRLVVAHGPGGPMSLPLAFLRQARIAQRRGEGDKAVMFARRAAQDAPQGDPLRAEAAALVKSLEASPVAARR